MLGLDPSNNWGGPADVWPSAPLNISGVPSIIIVVPDQTSAGPPISGVPHRKSVEEALTLLIIMMFVCEGHMISGVS